jgi:hypothetical protein
MHPCTFCYLLLLLCTKQRERGGGGGENDCTAHWAGADPSNCSVHSWSIGNLPYLFVHGLPARLTTEILRATVRTLPGRLSDLSVFHSE